MSELFRFNSSYQKVRLLSPLRKHKFCHNFLNPICNCSNVIELTKQYLLHCSNSKNEKQSLLQNVGIVNPNVLSMNEDALTHLLRLRITEKALQLPV